uniref:Protein Wnt n=1 Tax=Timema shepardi TaxID=629360 RepID=A0A7R9APK0_TIMSH|nr:unnamed protein product [Timema shepardi]
MKTFLSTLPAIRPKQGTMVVGMLLLKKRSLLSVLTRSTVCKTFPGLSKEQLELCHRYPDVTMTAVEGLQMAVDECQYQFQWHRWNCSSLSTKNKNPHSSVLLQKGYRESAFAYAISSAGVAHSVARACSMGRLTACGCDPSGFRATARRNFNPGGRGRSRNKQPPSQKKQPRASSRWKWGGCSHNVDFGVDFSEKFLDAKEKAGDIQSRINLHNNQAGRLAVSTNMQVRCKCHGMSGSCELKTCWKAAPNFRVVGQALKEKFRSAVLVDQSNLGNGSPLLLLDGPRKGATNWQRSRNNHRTNNRRRYVVRIQGSPITRSLYTRTSSY